MSNENIDVVNQSIEIAVERLFVADHAQNENINVVIEKINGNTYLKIPNGDMLLINPTGDFKKLIAGDILKVNREGDVVEQILKERIKSKNEAVTRSCKSRYDDLNSMF